MNPETLNIRSARPGEAGLVLDFIRGIAAYERLEHEVEANEEDIHQALFGPHPAAEVVLAFQGQIPAAFALFFHNFSTFVGRRGLYLEDLYVKPEFRGQGIGKALLLYLVDLARQRGCGRMEWVALDWNQPAIDFYRALGARPMSEWTLFRLDAADLARLVVGE